jgi:mono/diheme cytochrome c family protein
MAFPRSRLLVIALAALAAALAQAQAQTPTPPTAPADPAAMRGLAYARQSCAGCHSVEPGVPGMPDAAAPSFTAVAATPGMTSMALNVWFNTSHPNMPNLIISGPVKDDLLAYFDVLRAAAKAARAQH